MTKRTLLLLVFSFSSLAAETIWDKTSLLQNVNSISLDSIETEAETYWYLSDGEMDETEIQSINETNFAKHNWYRARVPGNLIRDAKEFEGKKTVLLAKWIHFPEQSNESYTLRLGVINDRDRTYLNGKKIGETGNWDSADPEAYDKIRIYTIPDGVIKQGKTNLLIIQIKPYFDYTVGVEQDKTEIGKSAYIYSKYYIDEFLKLIFLTVYLSFGSYFLFLFVRRRRETENLFFALFSFALVFYNFLRNQLKYEFGIPFVYMKEVEYMVLLSLIPMMFHFLRTLFKEKYLLVAKIFDSIQFIFFLLFLIFRNVEFFNSLMSKFIQPTWIVYVILIFYILFKNLKSGDRRAIYILIGMSIILIASFVDILSTRGLLVFPRILGYAFLAFNVSLAIILANSFVKLNEEVEDLNKNLEKKVEQRTDALNESLNQLKELKEKQDGDYFLTSLLIQPLAKNENKIPNIQIESYTDQKKKFQFRGKEGEIGGDICIVGSITLNSGNYTVFANGDAMGKSIQGAGGALVLGVVFHAVLSRSNSSYTKQRPPELWLKDLYVELQSVFVSFDGSMLSSVVLGLISETSGCIYYINAEHPWSILYRDGIASFIETELTMRKLGFPKNDESFQIKTFHLEEGDVLIVGSDGRDDIAFNQTENNRNINEDETLILRLIERAKGKLDALIHEIRNQGEITDDLSFLRIGFKPIQKENEFEEETKSTIETIKELSKKGMYEKASHVLETILNLESKSKLLGLAGKVYYKSKHWEKAIEYLNLASYQFPEKEDLIYLMALSFWKAGKISESILSAERLFLRNKYHDKNTKLFFQLLKKSGNLEKLNYYERFLGSN
ncbi:SpoIIE family protein phosphatase [Leptospira sp. 96542]|nr:SpoIIE family protein phosphatase [Leptospira sp. 96542]